MRSCHPLCTAAVLGALLSAACSQEAQAPAAEPAPASPAAPAPAAVEPAPSDFARFVRIGEDEGRFDVAVTTYSNARGQQVSLVAAVHLADAAHYAELQRELARYDVVLYELVAEPDDRPKPGEERAGSGSFVSFLQRMLKQGLELEFQLDAIDYTKENFVHADLTPQSFAAKMAERGESFLTIFWRLLQQEAQRMHEERDAQAEPGARAPLSFDLVGAFRKGNAEGRHTLRLLVAQQLEHAEALAAGIEPGDGSVLLEGRNEHALEVLRAQLALGHDALAIYYGAAHMPGIERTLLDEMGFSKTAHQWLVAWDIRRRAAAPQQR